MCNINIISDYISRIAGLDVKSSTGSIDKKKLPYMLSGSFDMHSVNIDGQHFVVLFPAKGIDFTGRVFVQRIKQIEDNLKEKCLLCIENINADMRRTLVGNRINFVVPDRQLSLPSMLLFLNERALGRTKKTDQDVFAPATQFILFYHLIKESLEGLKLMLIAEKVGYGLRSVGLAINELVAAGICNINQPDKRTKMVHFNGSKTEIWQNAQRKLSSPILSTYYINDATLLDGANLCYSYDSALTRCTMITQPSHETYAIEKNATLLKELQAKGLLVSEDGAIKIEVWKYPIERLAHDGIADPLSLWMCYRSEEDERVDGELERLILKRLNQD